MSGYYSYKGFSLPRVTTICSQLDKSPALMGWAVNCMRDYINDRIDDDIATYSPSVTYKKEDIMVIVNDAKTNYKEVSREAMDIGSLTHSAIEEYLLTGKEPKNPRPEVLSAFVAFLEWKDANTTETIKVEHSVYSLNPPYAGTLDWICLMDEKKYYIDFKTSKAVYEPSRYQIAAYRQTDDDPDSCGSGILRLDKETGYPEFKDLTDKYDNDVDIFNDLCKLWWKRKPKLRKKFLNNGGVL